jgi:Mn-dependent DtxR family transcriptional regulator
MSMARTLVAYTPAVSKEPLSDAIQHYLREIYKLAQVRTPVTITALAKAQGVSPASASAMVK